MSEIETIIFKHKTERGLPTTVQLHCANEIAIPLYDAIMEKCNLEVSRSNKKNRYIVEFYTSFIEGYSQENNLADSMLTQVPLLITIAISWLCEVYSGPY